MPDGLRECTSDLIARFGQNYAALIQESPDGVNWVLGNEACSTQTETHLVPTMPLS